MNKGIKNAVLGSIFGLLCVQPVFAEAKIKLPPPGSHFRFSTSGYTLTVNTTTPNRTYPNAGIQIISPGYTVSGNVFPTKDGFYLFSVSDTVAATINLIGPSGEIRIKLCLDGVGKKYSCEYQTVSGIASPDDQHIIFVTSTTYSGDLGGTAGADALCQAVAYQSGSLITFPGLKFKALLVTPTRYPCSSINGGVSGSCGGSYASSDWPLVPGTPYMYSDGITFFNTVNQYGVFDGSNTIIDDETGFAPLLTFFWMGIQSIFINSAATDIAAWAYTDMNSAADGTNYATYLASCNGFTDATGSDNGSVGANGNTPFVVLSPPALTWGNYFYFSDSGLSNAGNLFNVGNQPCNTLSPIVCVS